MLAWLYVCLNLGMVLMGGSLVRMGKRSFALPGFWGNQVGWGLMLWAAWRLAEARMGC